MVYWIREAQPHRLAIVPRPRGNDWLEDDLKALASGGIQILVSLRTAAESNELGVAEERFYGATHGIEFLTLPIEDRSVPSSSIPDFVRDLAQAVESGKAVGFHCRAGIGRSSMLAALVFARLGWSVTRASCRHLRIPGRRGSRHVRTEIVG